ncbi:MAG: helix-turn-helix domain-containing protein [Candidatus Eremiobacterota bacterium]
MDLITSGEVIEMLRISKSTLHRWISNGKLKTYRTGKKLKFDYKEVIEVIEEYKPVLKNASTKEEIIRKIKSLKGKYSNCGVSTEDYIKRKEKDMEMEEIYEKKHNF